MDALSDPMDEDGECVVLLALSLETGELMLPARACAKREAERAREPEGDFPVIGMGFWLPLTEGVDKEGERGGKTDIFSWNFFLTLKIKVTIKDGGCEFV